MFLITYFNTVGVVKSVTNSSTLQKNYITFAIKSDKVVYITKKLYIYIYIYIIIVGRNVLKIWSDVSCGAISFMGRIGLSPRNTHNSLLV